MKRIVGALLSCVACMTALTGLTGCDVTQINWANHFYTVSSACIAPGGSVTLNNGTGVFTFADSHSLTGVGHARVTLAKTMYGDFNVDGVSDVVNVLVCTDADGGNAYGAEIQVFTRNGTPVERVTAPGKVSPSGIAPVFDVRSVVDHPFWGVDYLIAGVRSYASTDARCCPSQYTTYQYRWNPLLKVFSSAPWDGVL
jgi:hypothetical protein